MMEEMMNYLKMKQDIINGIDWNKENLTEEEIQLWEKTLREIVLLEPIFFTITPEIYDHIDRQLTLARLKTKGEIQKSLAQLSCQITKANQVCQQTHHYRDDYYQWITLMRTDPNPFELSTREMMRQMSLDYSNMQALINQENDKLIGNYDFLTTLNFTMTMFPSVYDEQQNLLNQSREIVEQGKLVNPDRSYQKLAKRTMRRLDLKMDHQKSKRKETITKRLSKVFAKK